jgi:predicted dehydrogenase
MKRGMINRRQFMEGAITGLAAVAAARRSSPALGAAGANERIRLGCIGIGGQGGFHMSQWARMPEIRVVAVCDVDQSHLDRAAEAAGTSPRKTKDFREVLDMKDVDAVCIATPDHWHSILAIQACQAGKHIYVEKPMSHDIKEGRAVAEAVKQSKVVLLHGTQQRSGTHWASAVERVKAGEIGKINMVHAWNAWDVHQMYGSLGRHPDQDAAPPGVDYDRWLGPAPLHKFNPARFHGTFYYFWDYSGGMISGWGVHLFDVVMWAMGSEIKSVATVGGKFVHQDMRETPDTADATFEFPTFNLHYSMKHGNGWGPHGTMDHGIEFFGTDGTLQIDRMGFQVYDEADRVKRKPVHTEQDKVDDFLEHKKHFIECIRGNAKPRCDAETAHKASSFGHLANLSHVVGRRLRWDAAKEAFIDDAEAGKLLGRTYREPWHL